MGGKCNAKTHTFDSQYQPLAQQCLPLALPVAVTVLKQLNNTFVGVACVHTCVEKSPYHLSL